MAYVSKHQGGDVYVENAAKVQYDIERRQGLTPFVIPDSDIGLIQLLGQLFLCPPSVFS